MAELDTKDIKNEVEDFFQKVGLKLKAEVTQKDDSFDIDLVTDETGLLIGRHGDTLQDFQTVISIILNNKYKGKNWVRFNFDVGGWKQTREEDIEQLTKKAVERVRATGESYALPPMKSAERRLVHVLIADFDDIASESEGAGSERHVVLSLGKEDK